MSSNAAFISPEAMALMQEDTRLWEKARVKEDPFNIKAPDGNYIGILAKVQVTVKAKDGNKGAHWKFLWVLVCDADTGKNTYAGTQIIINHELIGSEKVTKEQKYEYLNFDLKALGVVNAKELTITDFPDVVRGLNTQRKAGIITIKTANGFKNGRLKETIKLEAVKPYLTPETEALLAAAIAADEAAEAGGGTATAGGGDALDEMDRAQLLNLNKEHNLGCKTKGKPDDEVRALVRAALQAKAAEENEEEEESDEEEEGEADDKPPFDVDPLAGKTRTELLAIKKEYNLSFLTKNETDDVVRERLREALKNVEAQPDESGEE